MAGSQKGDNNIKGISEIEPKLAELLKNRGIEEGEMEEFLSPKPTRTYDPFLLHNMEEGVDLVLSAIEGERRICIYGDYDVDGVTSTVILWEVLSELGADLTYYIPSRFDEGYGLNKEAVTHLHQQGIETIITVDCGSVSVEEVELARELGMEVLVTDHHRVTDTIAPCIVINPNQPDCTYPCKYLAGCGVAFKLAQALVEVTGLPKRVLTRELDMVALGTVADIVPLLDENRTLVKFGLRAINTCQRENLLKLIQAVGLKPGQITSQRIAFGIAPYLNAAGRMEHASIAADIFLDRDENRVTGSVDRVIACNARRRQQQEDVFEMCLRDVEENRAEDGFLVLCPERASEGIIGIVAGKIKERYNRPALVFTEGEDGFLKGSGRSIQGVDLYDILKENQELYERFGGHKAACGLTIKKENLDILRERLCASIKKLEAEDPQLLEKKVTWDMELSSEDISMNMVDQLALLEPCGAGNESPVISVEGRGENLSRMGSEGQYLRLSVRLQDGRLLPAVVFRNADEVEKAIEGSGTGKVRFLGTLTDNVWKDRRSLQFLVNEVDVQVEKI